MESVVSVESMESMFGRTSGEVFLGARPGDLAHWQLDLAIGNARTLATLDQCCQCETVASSNVASFQSKGPSFAFRPRPWKSPIKKREGRTCVRTHPACRPS